MTEIPIQLHKPHAKQLAFKRSKAKRKVIVAGRRGGKTTGVSDIAIEAMLAGRRVLEAAPVADQTEAFWRSCKRALAKPIAAGYVYKNETDRLVEIPGKGRIRSKTAWNADMLRGDYADLLILDEYSLMDEGAWAEVGAPMLLDNNGDAIFIFTPKRRNHAYKMFERAKADDTGRWDVFHFTSMDNPYLSKEALAEITQDMTNDAYRQEIMAEFLEDDPNALWQGAMIEQHRAMKAPDLKRIIVGVDPSATSTGDEAGIVVAGLGVDGQGYVLDDVSLQGSPNAWGSQAVAAYHKHKADRIVAEVNNGGEMVELTLRTIDRTAAYRAVHASRGKATRAEPIAALYEQGKVHHVGIFPKLEDEMTSWTPGAPSPNRMDALVWALTELMLKGRSIPFTGRSIQG